MGLNPKMLNLKRVYLPTTCETVDVPITSGGIIRDSSSLSRTGKLSKVHLEHRPLSRQTLFHILGLHSPRSQHPFSPRKHQGSCALAIFRQYDHFMSHQRITRVLLLLRRTVQRRRFDIQSLPIPRKIADSESLHLPRSTAAGLTKC